MFEGILDKKYKVEPIEAKKKVSFFSGVLDKKYQEVKKPALPTVKTPSLTKLALPVKQGFDFISKPNLFTQKTRDFTKQILPQAEVKKEPNKNLIGYTEVGQPIFKFPYFLGGGTYIGKMTEANPPTTERTTYGGVPSTYKTTGQERDHIVSLFLGGADTKENIKMRQSANLIEKFLDIPVSKIPKERRQEGKYLKEMEIYDKYNSGKITRAEAIIELKRWEYEQEIQKDKEVKTGDIISGLRKIGSDYIQKSLLPAADQTFRTIRASSQLASTPFAYVFDKISGGNLTYTDIAKENVSRAKDLVLNKATFSSGVEEGAQLYLKSRNINKLEDIELKDIGVLTVLGISNIFGDPLLAIPFEKVIKGTKEFLAFKKVGQVEKTLPEGAVRTAPKGTTYEIPITKVGDVKVKIIPKDNSVIFKGYVKRGLKFTQQQSTNLTNIIQKETGLVPKIIQQGSDLIINLPKVAPQITSAITNLVTPKPLPTTEDILATKKTAPTSVSKAIAEAKQAQVAPTTPEITLKQPQIEAKVLETGKVAIPTKEAVKKTETDLTKSIQQAKAEGKSFDEWVKGKGKITLPELKQLKSKVNISETSVRSGVDNYKKMIKSGEDVGSIVVDSRTMEVLEGNHRLKAYQELGIIPKNVVKVDGLDFKAEATLLGDKEALNRAVLKTRSQLRAEWEKEELQKQADKLKEQFNQTKSGDILRQWRSLQNKIDESQAIGIEIKNKEALNKQRILDESIKKKDKTVDLLSNEDIATINEIAKNSDNLDDFLGKMRGSASQYGAYTPKLRQYVRPESVFVGDIKGLDPNTTITVYRGLDVKSVGNKKINKGDFVTTDYQDALQYTDSPSKVVSLRTKLKNLVAEYPDEVDITNPKNPVSYELLYIPDGKIKKITNTFLSDIYNKTRSQLKAEGKSFDEWVKDIEGTAIPRSIIRENILPKISQADKTNSTIRIGKVGDLIQDQRVRKELAKGLDIDVYAVGEKIAREQGFRAKFLSDDLAGNRILLSPKMQNVNETIIHETLHGLRVLKGKSERNLLEETADIGGKNISKLVKTRSQLKAEWEKVKPAETKTQFLSPQIRPLTSEEEVILPKIKNVLEGRSSQMDIADIPEFFSVDNKIRPLVFSETIANKIKIHGNLVPENLVINANDWDIGLKNMVEFGKGGKKVRNQNKINLIKKIPDSENYLVIGANLNDGFYMVTHFEVIPKYGNELKSLLGRGELIDRTGRPLYPEQFLTLPSTQKGDFSGVSGQVNTISVAQPQKFVKVSVKPEVKIKEKPVVKAEPKKPKSIIKDNFSTHWEKVKQDLGITGEQLRIEPSVGKAEQKWAYDFIQRNPSKAMKIAYNMILGPSLVKEQAIRASLKTALRMAGKNAQADVIDKTMSQKYTEIAQALNIAKLDLSRDVEKASIRKGITDARLEKIGKEAGEKNPEKMKETGEKKVKAETKKAGDKVAESRSKITSLKELDNFIDSIIC